MKKIAATLMLALASVASTAQATVTFAPTLGLGASTANNAAGNPITDGTYVMVLDLDNDGWNGNSYTAQETPKITDNSASFLWDADDKILDIGQIGGPSNDPGTAFPQAVVTIANTPGYTAGVDHFFVLWFDRPFDPSATGPGTGVHYGAEDLGTAGNDGSTLTPDANGGNATFTTFGDPIIITPPPAPEPASAMTLLIGGGLLLARRRNR